MLAHKNSSYCENTYSLNSCYTIDLFSFRSFRGHCWTLLDYSMENPAKTGHRVKSNRSDQAVAPFFHSFSPLQY